MGSVVVGRARRRAVVGAVGVACAGLAGCHLGAEVVSYETSSSSLRQLVPADVDGDGLTDVVATGYGSYAVALNDGTGGFTVVDGSAGTMQPAAAAVGELNGDGTPDLFTVTDYSTTVEVRVGDGAGRFSTTRRLLPAWGPLFGALGVADLDGDGDDDVAAGGSGGVGIWLAGGGGGFAQPYAVDMPGTPYGLGVADVSGDGVPDLVASTYLGSGEGAVVVALGDGTGDFAPAAAYPNGPDLRTSLALGDVDGDGDLDAVTGRQGTGVVVAQLNDGTGAFGPPISSPTLPGEYPSVTVVALADIDGDGHLDTVTNNAVLFGDGAGTFVEPHSLVGGVDVVPLDADRDGAVDLVYANQGDIRVVRNGLEGGRDHP